MQPATQGTLVYLNAGETLDPWLARVEGLGGQVSLSDLADSIRSGRIRSELA